MGSLVSLVMSDIVDSTRRWNAAEGAMAADLELHDRLIRQAVETSGGTVFKHTGDGMIAMFDDPVAAVDAAAAIQRTISAAQWQQPDQVEVRAAVHSGVVYPRDGDLFGTAVNKVARILGTCPPRAVLVSSATTALLAERAPEGLELRPVGSVLLAGFSAPDALYALVGPGLLAIDTVADRTHAQQSRLPSIDDELVGRSDELATVWDALERSRLVTLAGVGGMGKTRLALEVAAGAAESFADGAWWIDLSNATSSDAALSVAMAAVGAREAPGRTPLQAFCDHFVGRSALVVVDNCEHVLGAAADMVAALRSAAADVRLVCTSREALGVRGEHIVPIGSLPVSDGVELFIERARAVQPDLRVDDDRDVIERLCVRLDGIPLAIELAAARCRAMTPAEVDARLDDRFRLLRGGRSGAERHRTLQAAVAWSYSLLDSGERAVFDKMAVFAGGTCIDGLAAVCDLDELDALDIVDRLVARSMVVATRTPLGTRYHQLETLRQYGEDRLVEAEAITDARDRHLTWVAALSASMRSRLGTPKAADAFARFTAELDNLRVAVAHAVGTGQHRRAHRIVAEIWVMALDRPAWEVADWCQPLRLDDGWTEDAAVCAAALSHFDEQRFGPRGRQWPIGDVPAEFLTSSGFVALAQTANLGWNGDWAGAIEYTDTVRFTDEYYQRWVTGTRVFAMGFAVNSRGALADEVDRFIDLALDNLERARRLGDRQLIGHASYFAAYALLERDPLSAIELAREATALAEQLGAHYLYGRSNAVLLTAQGAAVAARLLAPQAVASSLRAQLAHSFDMNHLFLVNTLTRASTRLLAPLDARAAALVARSVQLHTGMPPAARVVQAIEADSTLDVAAIDAEASTMTVADSVRVILEALDRVIAAGGDS